MPKYSKNKAYSLIASWVESCGYEIRYKERDVGNTDLGFTCVVEYGPSYIQMYTNEELYVEYWKTTFNTFGPAFEIGDHAEHCAGVGAANVLAHELAHQIFKYASYKPFVKVKVASSVDDAVTPFLSL